MSHAKLASIFLHGGTKLNLMGTLVKALLVNSVISEMLIPEELVSIEPSQLNIRKNHIFLARRALYLFYHEERKNLDFMDCLILFCMIGLV